MIQRLTVARAAGGAGGVALPDPVHLGKAAGVPQLGAEISVTGDAAGGKPQVAPHRRHRGQGEAHRVAAVLVDQLQRVEHVAERLRHLLALLITHQGMDIDGAERHLTHHGQLHHHHPRHPEEDDIEPGDQG